MHRYLTVKILNNEYIPEKMVMFGIWMMMCRVVVVVVMQLNHVCGQCSNNTKHDLK